MSKPDGAANMQIRERMTQSFLDKPELGHVIETTKDNKFQLLANRGVDERHSLAIAAIALVDAQTLLRFRNIQPEGM